MTAGYQPRWSDGRTLGDSVRDAETRYEAISKHILPMSRVLDFGAWKGYFAHRLADQKRCRVVAVDPLAEAAPLVTAIQRQMEPQEIKGLGLFDVTLALSVIHNNGKRWEEYLDALLGSAPLVFVETASPEEKLKTVGPEVLKQIYERVMRLGVVVCWTGGRYDAKARRPTVMIRR